MCSFPEASRGCWIGAHAANTQQVAVWDRPGWLVTVCSPSLASFICYGRGQNAISCEGGGWQGGGGVFRGPGDAENIKGPWKLSGTWVLPALHANSPVLAHPVVHPDVSYCDAHCSQCSLIWECVCVRRIKIPLHLEAQTPWATALRAAIRHVAIWGEGHSLSLLPPFLSNTDTLLLSSLSFLQPAGWASSSSYQ